MITGAAMMAGVVLATVALLGAWMRGLVGELAAVRASAVAANSQLLAGKEKMDQLRAAVANLQTHEKSLLTEKRGHVLVLTLNRPHAKNSFNAALSQALSDAIDQFDLRQGTSIDTRSR